MLIVTIILGIIISLLFFEKWITHRSVNSLHLRIHVNGTRGKSSVTEYIAAGIFKSETSVMAKITGIIPTIIYNGKAKPINRVGISRVQEQFSIIRLAAKKNVKSLVLECMSVAPELQRLESRFFKPHIYVITNIKDDHREEMGKSLKEQAESICNSIPKNCIVITGETTYIDTIKEKSALNDSKVIIAQELDQTLSDCLPPGIFPENISLALAVCEAAGIEQNDAKEGIMNRVSESSSPLTTINYNSKQIRFLNGFAVNDVASTESFLNYWRNKLGYTGKISIIFNTRADRPFRTDLIAGWIADLPLLENIIITGDHVNRAVHSLRKAGTDKRNLFIWRRRQLDNFKANLFNLVPEGSLVVGVGNIGGDGFVILNKLL